MKKILLLSFAIMLFTTVLFSQVAINKDGSPPDPSAILDVKSITGGLLIPRMSEQEMVNIASPAMGLLVYVHDMLPGAIMYFSDAGWNKLVEFNELQPVTYIKDADNDTKVQVEKTTDEDKIRFDIEGTEYFIMDKGRLEFLNSGGSVFIGESAGENDDLVNNRNTFVGFWAGKSNIGGINNTAIGNYSLKSNISGSSNIAIGEDALVNNATGNSNIAIGEDASYYNTTGHSNVSIGIRALFNNTEKSNIVAIGDSALYNNGTGATTSDHSTNNTAVGSKSMYSNTTGYNNTAIGLWSLVTNTTGDGNVASGMGSLMYNTQGSNNIAIGNASLLSNELGNNNVSVGTSAGNNSTGSNNIFIGYNSGYNEIGSNKLYISNSDTEKPLIYGDFGSVPLPSLGFNGTVSNYHYMEFVNSDNKRTILISESETGTNDAGKITLFSKDGTTPTIEIDGDYGGDGRIITNEIQITGGSDLSEFFNLSDYANIKKGMVVSIDEETPGNLIVTTEAYDRKVAGIVSGANNIKPGLIMSQKGTIADGEHLIALTGRVYCMVDATDSPIEIGDMLTTSSMPGHAMKVNDFELARGAIIGKAMTSLKTGTGLVLVLVSLQ